MQTESGLLLQTEQFTGLEKGLFCLGKYHLDLTTLETANDVNYAWPCNFSWYRKLNVCQSVPSPCFKCTICSGTCHWSAVAMTGTRIVLGLLSAVLKELPCVLVVLPTLLGMAKPCGTIICLWTIYRLQVFKCRKSLEGDCVELVMVFIIIMVLILFV